MNQVKDFSPVDFKLSERISKPRFPKTLSSLPIGNSSRIN